jgi:hypothetical protein
LIRRVCVLYEDQRGPTKGFGLHELVKACVGDALPEHPRWRINAALEDCRPLKGSAKLLEACRRDIDLIANDDRRVVAVFDHDRIHQLLRLPKNASDKQIVQTILAGGKKAHRLSIVLLKRNMESVLQAAAQCDESIALDRIKRAVQHKDPLERDAILNELSSERARSVRDCILDQVPSLRTLIEVLSTQLTRPKGRRRTETSERKHRAKL